MPCACLVGPGLLVSMTPSFHSIVTFHLHTGKAISNLSFGVRFWAPGITFLALMKPPNYPPSDIVVSGGDTRETTRCYDFEPPTSELIV